MSNLYPKTIEEWFDSHKGDTHIALPTNSQKLVSYELVSMTKVAGNFNILAEAKPFTPTKRFYIAVGEFDERSAELSDYPVLHYDLLNHNAKVRWYIPPGLRKTDSNA